jgi:3-methylfumaryl-CoA hydratase
MAIQTAPAASSESEAADCARWLGKQEIVDEILSPFPATALRALLDHEPADESGKTVPPLGHWVYFLPIHRQSELADDGHVRRGGFWPPLPQPRRMFAGSRLSFVQPLRIGEAARRVGTITNIQSKQGRSGLLTFVSVRQEIFGPDGLALTEEQDIVYRGAPGPEVTSAPSSPPSAIEQWGRDVMPDAAMLFRYSALLFNAHRIHYDWPYATEREGYPGLVVHGQLVATLLADLARAETGSELGSFEYRSVRAFVDGAHIRLSGHRDGDRVQLWATQSGQVGTLAEARLRPGT